MVRACRHHCGDRRKHTLAYAGQQVLLMCEIAHVVQKHSSDISLIAAMLSTNCWLIMECCLGHVIVAEKLTSFIFVLKKSAKKNTIWGNWNLFIPLVFLWALTSTLAALKGSLKSGKHLQLEQHLQQDGSFFGNKLSFIFFLFWTQVSK